MAGTVLGRLLIGISSSSGDTDENSRNIYRSVYDFLKTQVEPAGYATEIARLGSESGVPVNGAFSVWRWNTSSLRNWEWYMLIQNSIFGGITSSAEPGQINSFDVGGVSATGIAAAVGIQHETGSYDFFNPWNGTTNLNGTDSKGNPVWSSGSADSSKDIHVGALPRANISGSRYAGDEGNDASWLTQGAMAYLAVDNNPGNGCIGYLYADEDSFFSVWRDASSGEATVHDHISVFVGPYTPHPSLSASMPAPLVMYHVGTGDEVFPDNTNGYFEAYDSGVVSIFPISGAEALEPIDGWKSTSAVVFGRLPNWETLSAPDKQLRIVLGTTSSVYPSPPIHMWRWESPYGYLGQFNSQLYRTIPGVGGNEFRYATTNSGSSGLRRAFLPASTTGEADGSYSVFWSGSLQPGTGSIPVTLDISGAVRF